MSVARASKRRATAAARTLREISAGASTQLEAHVEQAEVEANLEGWLSEQARHLNALTDTGNRLKLDYVQNARDKGEILSEVENRVSHIPGRFLVWITSEAGIGISTARLYMDVARNYENVKERFVDSNPLELTLRNVRDAIRDKRQDAGGGKPGSGKRINAATQPTPDTGDHVTDDLPVQENAADNDHHNVVAPPTNEKAAKLIATARTNHPPSYKLTVVTPEKSDLEKFGEVLPSPITDFNAHSVSVRIRLDDITVALEKVSKALVTTQPKKVKIIVEL
jgi:hypothetical protein